MHARNFHVEIGKYLQFILIQICCCVIYSEKIYSLTLFETICHGIQSILYKLIQLKFISQSLFNNINFNLAHYLNRKRIIMTLKSEFEIDLNLDYADI